LTLVDRRRWPVRARGGTTTFTAATVAETINRFVQEDASDGFILLPRITPDGIDEFADLVVPLLQERGVFRTDYGGTTLREHLGLPSPR
jgi:alkanesulfonate monooxygenase SsuD/methylene tetrahydromethanopterin reductase-like flavin-dependent oxidoreductase (luciferase family)